MTPDDLQAERARLESELETTPVVASCLQNGEAHFEAVGSRKWISDEAAGQYEKRRQIVLKQLQELDGERERRRMERQPYRGAQKRVW